MKAKTYIDAASFLRDTQADLELNEAANSLMLGICGQLVRFPERVKTAPCLKTVEDHHGLVLTAVMTPPHKLVVVGHRGDLEAATAILVKDLVGEGWQVPGVLGPSEVAKGVAERWAEVARTGSCLERRQRVYELREVMSPVPERGSLRLAREAEIELVAQWWVAFHIDVFGEADREGAWNAAELRIGNGDIYLWEDRMPVSLAMKNRPTRSGISVSLVYTPPEQRGRGYATACVGELSRALLASGWGYCALFADLSNAAANRMYQRIGYRPACDYDEYAFLDGE
ncbi:GNAT family N-acetyltransferase [Chloroflexota bacterium]